ncbi:hypothetical protein A1F99_140160 [Pyrenophora tritici-repentis]|nr:hypothetical protein A1F99_140160 [Pyrenophora tritici-repentis]
MLVVQRSVVAAEDGEVEHPSYMLDEMRERFMVRGSRTAFDWACRLRSYAKKVVSNTTSLGYIAWSEDGSLVTYKDTGFSMDALRKFIAVQVKKAQQELEDLLLLHPEEARDDIVPPVYLYRLQDNHSNGQKGWNFLKDQRNADQLQEGGDRWLLNRVLENDWLRNEMVAMSPESQLRWKKKAVQAYFEKVDKFLERLLLLIHMTGGQPPRGTELIGLQHSNTAQGQHRGIFLEEGLISTVTSYHKGYNITGSTKIIHRYLPKEVSELLVYYLWLILPFWQQLDILVYKRKDPHSTFLWPKGSGTWDSSRLTRVIAREARLYLDTTLSILIYRHLAIAISRQHLPCGGFKRDYGVHKKIADQQATHGTWIAGTVKNKVVRQLNVIHKAVPTEQHETWNVISKPTIEINTQESVLGLDNLALVESDSEEEQPTSEYDMLEDESKDLEATEIDQTKFGKMAMFEGINRPPTPYIQEEEFYKLARQINQLLRHLNKAKIEYACEEPNIMAAMRQDFYRLSLE